MTTIIMITILQQHIIFILNTFAFIIQVQCVVHEASLDQKKLMGHFII